jgi:hypothetical protein
MVLVVVRLMVLPLSQQLPAVQKTVKVPKINLKNV